MPVYVNGVMLQIVGFYKVVVGENHLDGFVVKNVDRMCALAAVCIAGVVVTWHDVGLSMGNGIGVKQTTTDSRLCAYIRFRTECDDHLINKLRYNNSIKAQNR